jgi:hypothetical protein
MRQETSWRPQALRWAKGLAVVVALPAFSAVGVDFRVAQAGQLPTVESVLERYVEVTGGREALLRHKSMTVHGRYQVPAAKLDVETVAYTGGGRFLQVAMLSAGKSMSGYDGHTAWDLDSHGKATIHEGDEVKSIARDADMYYHLHVMQYFRSLEVIDVRPFNSRPCYHLKGVNNWGRENEQFYDTETGLLLGYAFNTAWRGGKGDATATFENYRDFGGVRMAAKTTTRDGDSLSVFTITSVTYDDVPDSMFALPEGVRAKLKG